MKPAYNRNEWSTPSEYIEAARTVMSSIDLDPASSNYAQRTVKATVYYSKNGNGLLLPWRGNVWLNPPYSQPLISQFVDKALDEYEIDNVESMIILVNNATDTKWFHRLLAKGLACFTRGRVKFHHPERDSQTARQGQVVFYLGPDPFRFLEVFCQFGYVLRKF